MWNMGKVWVVDAIRLNCSMELDSTNCSIGFGEISFAKWCNLKNPNSSEDVNNTQTEFPWNRIKNLLKHSI